jgi:hypothetical protein
MQGKPQFLTAFSETDYRLFTHKRSIRTPDGWKLIYTLEDGKKELYSLTRDPGELRNVVGSQKQKAYELEQELFKWLASMKIDPYSLRGVKELKIKEY